MFFTLALLILPYGNSNTATVISGEAILQGFEKLRDELQGML